MAEFKSTQETLERACCAFHSDFSDGYSPDCATCVHRYYQFLIDDNYVATHRFEELQRETDYQRARANSLEVERDEAWREVAVLETEVSKWEEGR
jgi:hypothetical protein